jgi:hypothetical protein
LSLISLKDVEDPSAAIEDHYAAAAIRDAFEQLITIYKNVLK